jgi:vacuolar-type H+-ATPase subunit E/Vma4
MESKETIITKIIDLDVNAEKIYVQARKDTQEIQRNTLNQIETERKDLEKQIGEKVAEIQTKTELFRNAELEKVRNEFSSLVESSKKIPDDKIDRCVQLVVSKIKGNFE